MEQCRHIFKSTTVNLDNLLRWKKGGHVEWLGAHRERCERVERRIGSRTAKAVLAGTLSGGLKS